MQPTVVLDELVGSVVAGRYRIEERLGDGAMGAVYRARHVKLGRPFAIKILHDHLSDQKVLKRFEREAEIAGKLHHPNLVCVVDVGAIGGRSYLLMELAPGASLASLITGPWPASRMIPLVRQLCDGLHYAHELGLIHRDFKPENVIVERHADNRETPRIVDFGIALLRDATAERFTTAGLVLGTPQYMAPEQAVAGEMDHRVDLFALGVICYELLTGRAPFDGTGVDVARANLLTPTPAMNARAPTVQVDPLLEAFTKKLLAKKKEDRPVSALAARQLLDLIERDRPAAAKALRVTLKKTTEVAPPAAKAVSQPIPFAARSQRDIGTDRTVQSKALGRQPMILVAGVATVAFAAAIAIAIWAARRSPTDKPREPAAVASAPPASEPPPQPRMLPPPSSPAAEPPPHDSAIAPRAPAPPPSTSPPAAPPSPAPVAPPAPSSTPPPTAAAPSHPPAPAPSPAAAPVKPPVAAPPAGPPVEPTAGSVANLYVAVGHELKAYSDAQGQAVAADLWSRYRRIPINDVLVTPARRQATTELLLQIRRDLATRTSP